jgi:magnesium chelatase family protein
VGNARLPVAALRQLAQPDREALRLWQLALAQHRISARGGEQLLRVARTICDLSGERQITADAIAEALLFRCMDQQNQQG